jgi:hypothetical protein
MEDAELDSREQSRFEVLGVIPIQEMESEILSTVFQAGNLTI